MNERNVYSVPEMRRVRRIHMIGVGGSGMNGIAEVLVNLGYAPRHAKAAVTAMKLSTLLWMMKQTRRCLWLSATPKPTLSTSFASARS